MIVTLRYRFEKLINKGWVIVAYYIFLWLNSGQHFSSLSLPWIISFVLITLVYLFLTGSTIKFEIVDDHKAVSYWGLTGLKFGLQRIQKSEIKDLAIVQLPSNHYALVLKLKNRPDFILYSALNKKLLNEKLITFKNEFSHSPFFKNFSIEFHPSEIDIDKRISINRHDLNIN